MNRQRIKEQKKVHQPPMNSNPVNQQTSASLDKIHVIMANMAKYGSKAGVVHRATSNRSPGTAPPSEGERASPQMFPSIPRSKKDNTYCAKPTKWGVLLTKTKQVYPKSKTFMTRVKS